jgi:pimeloyl-ACP methyl ester carboxylesterase
MGRINLNGIHLNFESIRVEDPVSDTILLFLHEALGSIVQWKSFPMELCKSLRLNGIVYERQGHGKSDAMTSKRNSRYLHEYAFVELPAFINTLFSADQKIILVGHSDGGTIALLYAAHFPKKIEGVITMAAHVINEAETVAGIAPAVKAYQEGKLNRLGEFHGEKTDDLFYAWADTWNTPEFKMWNIIDEISNLNVPVLAIQGAKDQYGTKKQLNLIKEHVNGNCTTVLIPDCGHHPHLEKSAETTYEIMNWKQILDEQFNRTLFIKS